MPNGSMGCAIFGRGHGSWRESSAWQRGIRETRNLSVKALRSCESITAPGYRVYYKQQGRELLILLAGGDKGTQARDIKTALRLARNL